MDKEELKDTLVREFPKEGLEIIPGTFVVDKAKFLITNLKGMRSKSKIVRNASRYLLLAYSLQTGEEIQIDPDPIVKVMDFR